MARLKAADGGAAPVLRVLGLPDLRCAACPAAQHSHVGTPSPALLRPSAAGLALRPLFPNHGLPARNPIRPTHPPARLSPPPIARLARSRLANGSLAPNPAKLLPGDGQDYDAFGPSVRHSDAYLAQLPALAGRKPIIAWVVDSLADAARVARLGLPAARLDGSGRAAAEGGGAEKGREAAGVGAAVLGVRVLVSNDPLRLQAELAAHAQRCARGGKEGEARDGGGEGEGAG
jgi:hypothetical protein